MEVDTTPDATNVTLVNCTLNDVYLYDSVKEGDKTEPSG